MAKLLAAITQPEGWKTLLIEHPLYYPCFPIVKTLVEHYNQADSRPTVAVDDVGSATLHIGQIDSVLWDDNTLEMLPERYGKDSLVLFFDMHRHVELMAAAQWSRFRCKFHGKVVFIVARDLVQTHRFAVLEDLANVVVHIGHRDDPTESVIPVVTRVMKPNGKILLHREHCRFAAGKVLQAERSCKAATKLDNAQNDLRENLTFNLHLTEQQEASRANVTLPYASATNVGAIIHYVPDEVDDFDEEDPDDDLDI